MFSHYISGKRKKNSYFGVSLFSTVLAIRNFRDTNAV